VEGEELVVVVELVDVYVLLLDVVVPVEVAVDDKRALPVETGEFDFLV
tara:strand:+ start:973 stop:1116 length:144 start_codon:yes stop_codon:yes gene_type:complete